MAFQVGDHVLVPASRLGIEAGAAAYALHHTSVIEVVDRSVRLRLPSGETSAPIAKSLVHSNVGVAIMKIGDFATEATLLDPLAKSILHFCRLLASDDYIRFISVRSIDEISAWWLQNHAAYSHIVLVGHGSKTGITFAIGGHRTADEISAAFSCDGCSPKNFISLCCQTGFAGFAKTFSKSAVVDHLIAPFHSIHGAVASQFCQTYLAYHFLDGNTSKVAFNGASNSVPTGASFRLWKSGELAK